jgi:Ala-tRNA(Pro) deacylase
MDFPEAPSRGDHETLLHMGYAQFAHLTANAPHGCFSAHD